MDRPPAAHAATTRGQTEAVAYILVISMVMASAVTIVVFGAGALGASQDALSSQRAEKTLTQLDSQAALVALGSSDGQFVSLPGDRRGQFRIDGSAGWVNLSIDANAGGDTTIFNETLGALIYESQAADIAYQGGGVWRADGDRSRMISPPEFHYRSRTLTLPMITLSGDAAVTGGVSMSHTSTQERFPLAGRTGFENPVEGDAINLTVSSQFYRGWGAYFATRTPGGVTYDHENDTVEIRLIPHFDETYGNAVATTLPGGITVNGNDGPPNPSAEGLSYPLVNSRIESQIDDCQTEAAACGSDPSSITSAGTYFVDGDYSGELDVDSPGGNVTIVINGDLDPSTASFSSVSDPHSVSVQVRGDADIRNGITYNGDDGDPSESSLLLHSDGTLDVSGDAKFIGLIYAPGSVCTVNGGGSESANVDGGLVCETLTLNGDPSDISYDSTIQDADLSLNADEVTQLQFLHVTTNEIAMQSDGR